MRDTKDQRDSSQKIIDMVKQYIGDYTANMTKPVQKFILQMLYGTL